ncbi:MAG: HIT domain-containing protein [Candidatus Heimdallarchaeota archaeon]|nr:HIT domain-containing protein [Candidatus Heimdallarchaeota archaeon]
MAQYCSFCEIVAKREHSYTIYENEYTQVFLASVAIAEGHLLVIPKKHQQDIFVMEEDELEDLLKTTKIVSQRLLDKLHADGVNLLNASGKAAQQSVFHFHLHVVPRYTNDGMDLWFGKFDKYFDARNEITFDKLTR